MTDYMRLDFEQRSGARVRELGFRYRDLADEEAREIFFDKYGCHYTELLRLSYFDPVRMGLIDPMHNALLGEFYELYIYKLQPFHSIGIMRSQWHDSWIKTDALRQRTRPNQVKRELDLLNQYLKEVSFLYLLCKGLRTHGMRDLEGLI